MNWKIANIIRFTLIMLGISLFGLSILIFQTGNNFLAYLGIIIIIAGMLVGFLFYRCPQCGRMLAWRPIKLKYCHHCGCKLI